MLLCSLQTKHLIVDHFMPAAPLSHEGKNSRSACASAGHYIIARNRIAFGPP